MSDERPMADMTAALPPVPPTLGAASALADMEPEPDPEFSFSEGVPPRGGEPSQERTSSGKQPTCLPPFICRPTAGWS